MFTIIYFLVFWRFYFLYYVSNIDKMMLRESNICEISLQLVMKKENRLKNISKKKVKYYIS